jgi:DedD protein
MPKFTDDYTIYRMGLFSFLRKNKQETASHEGEFYSRAEEESKVVRTRSKSKQGNDPVDPVLPEKKRARRRLVGAIALVLGVIIGLPMILDSEPKPLAGDVAIQIPSKDKVARQAPRAAVSLAASATLDQKEEVVEIARAPSASANAQVAAPTDVGTPASSKPKDGITPLEVAKQTAPKAPEVAKQTAPKLADGEQDAKATAKQSAHSQSQPSEDAARAKAILEGKFDVKSDKATADNKPTKFVVQVAALASQDKINELQGKLKVAGIKSFTQKVATQSGQRTRIRVGPFASKEEADKMRTKLINLGLNGTLVPIS